MKAVIRPYATAEEMLSAMVNGGLGVDAKLPFYIVQPLSARARTDIEHLKEGGHHVHRNPKRKTKRPTMPTAQEHPDSLAEAMESVTEKEGK